ncbi:MAG: alpha/beta hydrolase [Chloroflexota bacterium]|nr:alpha/beta hydrolase [Chloroflexota bacterium]
MYFDPDTPNDYVVLLHGLGRTSRSMRALERILSQGFRVINIDYPSRRYPIERLAEHVGHRIHHRCPDGEKRIHFVTHSLGGIVLRYYLKENQLHNLGRSVMLSPPNRGNELVDVFRANVLFQVATGPAGQQLGTEPSSLPNVLGPVNFEVGIIAGNGSRNPVFSRLIPGADDGRVSVERSKVAGMADFLIVPQHHTCIMNSSQVLAQVIYFLENGEFRKERVA